jgi:hypothetical protein
MASICGKEYIKALVFRTLDVVENGRLGVEKRIEKGVKYEKAVKV